MRKVAVVVKSRANYARIRSVIDAINYHPNLELQLVLADSVLLPMYHAAADKII